MANLIRRKQVEDQGHISFFASRDANNQPDQALRVGANSGPSNQFPFIVPFQAEIYALTCGDRDQDPANATWDLQIEVNGIVQATLNKPAGRSSNFQELITPFPLDAGDLISIWMRNQNQTIRDPRGSVHIRKRR